MPLVFTVRIKSVSVSPAWEKRKLAVSVALDKTVKLWNIEDYSLQLSHRAHTVSFCFLCCENFIQKKIKTNPNFMQISWFLNGFVRERDNCQTAIATIDN